MARHQIMSVGSTLAQLYQLRLANVGQAANHFWAVCKDGPTSAQHPKNVSVFHWPNYIYLMQIHWPNEGHAMLVHGDFAR